MNFKLIREFSIKGLELKTKTINNTEKKNRLKKKSTNLIKKSNSNLKTNIIQFKDLSNLKKNINKKKYLDIIKDKEKEIELLKKELNNLRKLVINNDNKNKDKDKTNEKLSSKNSIIVSPSNGSKEREKICSFDINNSENNEKRSFGSIHSPKKSSFVYNNTLSYCYNHKGKYNSPHIKKANFSKLNLHNIIKKKSLSKDINRNNSNNKNKANKNEKDSKLNFEKLLERTKNLFEKLKK